MHVSEQWRPADLPQEAPELTFHEEKPENAEFPFSHLNGWIIPQRLFFRRNHFAYPTVDLAAWRLEVTGAVGRPLNLSVSELRAMARASQWTTLECSGNKRAYFRPPAEGTPWWCEEPPGVGHSHSNGWRSASTGGSAGSGPHGSDRP